MPKQPQVDAAMNKWTRKPETIVIVVKQTQLQSGQRDGATRQPTDMKKNIQVAK